jgi:flagellar basal body rod protein FlgG
MIKAIQSALSGLQNAEKSLNGAAQNIANPMQNDQIIEDIVSIQQAKLNYKANAQVLDRLDELAGELLKTLDRSR